MTKDIWIMGLALFSMFFGAGSVIFPVYLGMGAANQWFLGFNIFFWVDIGIAMLAIFVMLLRDSDVEGVMAPLGRVAEILMISAIILCIGPMLAIPRTGATVYEMAVVPVFGRGGLWLTSIIYFGLVLALSIRESAIVDILGKFLTPALFAGLVILIVKGVVGPIGPIAEAPLMSNVFEEGLIAGYQAMDVLGALAFGVLIVRIAASKGYTSYADKMKVIGLGSIIGGAGLFMVYCGLTYLGATGSGIFSLDINPGQLLVEIISRLLDQTGVVLLGIVIALACLTTAVALVGASASYFSRLSGYKISYRAVAILVCVFSAFISNIGLSAIISFAAPILVFVFPGALVMIFLTLFHKRIRNVNVYRFATAGALLVSTLEVAASLGAPTGFISVLPLSHYGFAWVLPAALGGLAGHLVKRRGQRDNPGN
jgi:LIVCS family branched-chain amino acid:cation transporter